MRWLDFKNEDVRNAVVAWWHSLSRRGDRAELRRCQTPDDVIFCPAFHRLRHALAPFGQFGMVRLATAAGLAAHIRSHADGALLADVLAGQGIEKTGLTQRRFRRLMEIDDHADLYRDMRRAIQHIGRTLDVADVARIIMSWGDYVKRDLATSYYSNGDMK